MGGGGKGCDSSSLLQLLLWERNSWLNGLLDCIVFKICNVCYAVLHYLERTLKSIGCFFRFPGFALYARRSRKCLQKLGIGLVQ